MTISHLTQLRRAVAVHPHLHPVAAAALISTLQHAFALGTPGNALEQSLTAAITAHDEATSRRLAQQLAARTRCRIPYLRAYDGLGQQIDVLIDAGGSVTTVLTRAPWNTRQDGSPDAALAELRRAQRESPQRQAAASRSLARSLERRFVSRLACGLTRQRADGDIRERDLAQQLQTAVCAQDEVLAQRVAQQLAQVSGAPVEYLRVWEADGTEYRLLIDGHGTTSFEAEVPDELDGSAEDQRQASSAELQAEHGWLRAAEAPL